MDQNKDISNEIQADGDTSNGESASSKLSDIQDEYMLFCPQCGRITPPKDAVNPPSGRCPECYRKYETSKILKVADATKNFEGCESWEDQLKEIKRVASVRRDQFEKETLPRGLFNKHLPQSHTVYDSLYGSDKGPVEMMYPYSYGIEYQIMPTTTHKSRHRNTYWSHELDAPALLGIMTAYALFSKKK